MNNTVKTLMVGAAAAFTFGAGADEANAQQTPCSSSTCVLEPINPPTTPGDNTVSVGPITNTNQNTNQNTATANSSSSSSSNATSGAYASGGNSYSQGGSSTSTGISGGSFGGQGGSSTGISGGSFGGQGGSAQGGSATVNGSNSGNASATGNQTTVNDNSSVTVGGDNYEAARIPAGAAGTIIGAGFCSEGFSATIPVVGGGISTMSPDDGCTKTVTEGNVDAQVMISAPDQGARTLATVRQYGEQLNDPNLGNMVSVLDSLNGAASARKPAAQANPSTNVNVTFVGSEQSQPGRAAPAPSGTQ